jgi:AcrR family transcriptional regulator
MTTVRPSMAGRSCGVHLLVLMASNVVGGYKDVNGNNAVSVNSCRYASPMTASARPYHHGNLRPALLAAAERALEGGGELSLRELAREIGVSHAAPRRHFAGKQALLDALAQDGFERLGRELGAALEQAAPTFADRLGAFARTYVRFATQHSALLDLMYAGKHRAGADVLRESADRAFAGPLALVAEGQAAGEVVAGDGERLGLLAWATFHGLASMAAGGLLGDRPIEPLVDEAVERLLEGLRPR